MRIRPLGIILEQKNPFVLLLGMALHPHLQVLLEMCMGCVGASHVRGSTSSNEKGVEWLWSAFISAFLSFVCATLRSFFIRIVFSVCPSFRMDLSGGAHSVINTCFVRQSLKSCSIGDFGPLWLQCAHF